MNLSIQTNLCKDNIENFSLLKDKKIKLFGIYKDTKYKNINKMKINNSLTISRNDIYISKEINLHFLKSNTNNSNENKNNSLKQDNLNIMNFSSLTENINKEKKNIKNLNHKNENNKIKKNYCKKKVPKENNKNVLIRPKMFEDTTIISNNKISSPFKEYPNKFNEKKNNIIYNPILYNNYNNNNYYSYNLNNNCFFNIPMLANPINFKNIYLNNSKTFEYKLKAPIISEKINFFNQNYIKINNNEKNELNKLNNSNIEKENKDNNLSDIFKIEKEKEKVFPHRKNVSLSIGNLKKGKIFLKKTNKSKGRIAKNNKNINIESKHTKHSADNMMRKIKNKVIESSRLLVNKIFHDEINNTPNLKYNLIYKEFRKIQGSFSQELNIKFNFWFYQITIKDIFTLEISNKYTAIEKTSNKKLIEYLYSPLNNNRFIKTKQLLNTPFHQYYHDIFLNEDKNWKKYYGINENDNKYQIEHLLKCLEEEEKEESFEKNKIYINDINKLAHNYEDYFLDKKPRKVDHSNKKNQFVKKFMSNTMNDKYLQLLEEVKQLKNYYDNRNLLKDKYNQIIFTKQKSEETMDNSLIKNNNYINLIINKEKSQIENNVIINKNNYINNFIELKNNIFDKKDKNEKENINENDETVINIKENQFCNKKRKNNNKIKYFISCKKCQKLDVNKHF